MSKEIKPDTLDFIFDFTREAPERQIQSAEALDNKMAQLFSVASVVIGLAGIASPTQGSGWTDWLLVAGLGFYILTAGVALIHLFPKVQYRSLHADVLWTQYWESEVFQIKHALTDDIRKAYARNRKGLELKSKLLKAATFTTGIEVLLIGLGLILSRVI